MTPTPNNEALAAKISEYGSLMFSAGMDAASDFRDRHRDSKEKCAEADELLDEIVAALSSGQAASAVPLPRLSGAFRTTVADGDRYAMVFQFQTLADLQAADQEWLDAKHLRPEVAAMGGQQPEESARAGTDIGQPVLGAGPALCTPSEAAELAGRFKLPVRFELGDEALREDCERLARMIDHVRASPTQPASAPAREAGVEEFPLPEPKPPNEEGSTTCVVRWMVELPNGMWLGAWDKGAFAAYSASLGLQARTEGKV